MGPLQQQSPQYCLCNRFSLSIVDREFACHQAENQRAEKNLAGGFHVNGCLHFASLETPLPKDSRQLSCGRTSKTCRNSRPTQDG